MKTKLELETIEIRGIKFDVYFNFDKASWFQIESIEDVTGAQDLMPLLECWVVEEIENKLHNLYERRGWL